MARPTTIPTQPRITTLDIRLPVKSLTMKYDPSRKATQREGAEGCSPSQKVNEALVVLQIPKDGAASQGHNALSPINVTLDQKPISTSNLHRPHPLQPQDVPAATWDDLVHRGTTLGDVGAPAALDPDDTSHIMAVVGQGDGQEHIQEQEEGENVKKWDDLVQFQAVLGEGGTSASEMEKKDRLGKFF